MLTFLSFKIKILLLVISTFLFTGCAVFRPTPKPDYTVKAANMDFVFVKGGTFQMGSADRPNEQPVHNVTVPDLFVGMYEVTFAQYDLFCNATGREKPSDEEWGRGNRPVINISWHDATAFAEWLSEQTGQMFSLPSEAHWEYFARAGTSTRYWMGNKIGKNAAQCENCRNKFVPKQTVPVGSFRPNPWGVHDTAGNVNEWCKDSRHRTYQGAPDDGRPWLNGTNQKVIYRGGSWSTDANSLRSSNRDYDGKDKRYNDIGFRLIMKSPIPSVQ